jgi:hypothetical protein
MNSGTLRALILACACATSTGACAGGTQHNGDLRSGTGAAHGERAHPTARVETTEYWLIGSESPETGVGASATEGASGSVGFDSSTSGSADRATFGESSEIDPARRSEMPR